MRSGPLRTSILILEANVTRNSVGSQVTEYKPTRCVRVEVVPKGGGRRQVDGEIAYPYTKTFRMRIYQKITERDRLTYNGEQYRILSIEDDTALQMKTVEAEKVEE